MVQSLAARPIVPRPRAARRAGARRARRRRPAHTADTAVGVLVRIVHVLRARASRGDGAVRGGRHSAPPTNKVYRSCQCVNRDVIHVLRSDALRSGPHRTTERLDQGASRRAGEHPRCGVPGRHAPSPPRDSLSQEQSVTTLTPARATRGPRWPWACLLTVSRVVWSRTGVTTERLHV